jgi:hypothetical protein
MKLAGFYLLSILATQMHFVWGDSADRDSVRQTPREVRVEAVQKSKNEEDISARMSAVFDVSSSCEEEGSYDYQIHDDEIVIESYKDIRNDGICLQKNHAQTSVDFEIRGLQADQIYYVYFLDEDGDPHYVGNLSTADLILQRAHLY